MPVWCRVESGETGRAGSRLRVIWIASSPLCRGHATTIYARADAGFYCWEAVEAYENHRCRFILVARKTSRLVEQLRAAKWKRSLRTDADEQCEFRYQPEGWGRAYRFIALRYEKPEVKAADETQQYQLFNTPEYTHRVFVTNMVESVDLLVWLYNQRAAAENLIKEANNDAGLAAHPSARWTMNCNHFQIAMLAYNLNCWLMLFNREEPAKPESKTYHPGDRAFAVPVSGGQDLASRGPWVSYSDQYAEHGIFQRLMDRLRSIAPGPRVPPVLAIALRL